MKNLVEELKAVVLKMQGGIEADVSKNGIIVIAMADGEMTVSVGVSPAELSKMVAHSMNADDNVEKIFSKGVALAPVLGLRDLLASLSDSEGEDAKGDTCDCEMCTLRRKLQARKAAANPNVN